MSELWDLPVSRPAAQQRHPTIASTTGYKSEAAAPAAAADRPCSGGLRLTKEQRQSLTDDEGCFRCGSVGHLWRNCPRYIDRSENCHRGSDCPQQASTPSVGKSAYQLGGTSAPIARLTYESLLATDSNSVLEGARKEAKLPYAFVLAMELGAEGASVKCRDPSDADAAAAAANATAAAGYARSTDVTLQGCPPLTAATVAAVEEDKNMAAELPGPAAQATTACPPGFRALKREDLDTAWNTYQPPKKR